MQPHNFLSTDAAGGTPTRRHALGRLPTPPPLPENLLSDCTENCPLSPLRAPRRFRNPKIGQQLGAQPTPRLGGGLGYASPARRGSRSRTASPPPSRASRKAPSASVESIEPRPPPPRDVSSPEAPRSTPPRPYPLFLHPRRSGWHPNSPADCTENCPLRPLRAPRRFGIRKSASNSGHSPLRGLGGCSMHCSMHYSMHCSTHCRPSLFAAHRR